VKQIDTFMYEVEPDEVVTMLWTAVKVIDSAIAMAVDQDGLEPDVEHPPTFSFFVTKPVNRMHFAAAEGSFPADTPGDARFSSVFRGSAGGVFQGPTIRHSDPPALHSVDLVFRVVAAASQSREDHDGPPTA
jgi:hypothetical protein